MANNWLWQGDWGDYHRGGEGVMLKEEIIKMGILQSGGKGGHGGARGSAKGSILGRGDAKRENTNGG